MRALNFFIRKGLQLLAMMQLGVLGLMAQGGYAEPAAVPEAGAISEESGAERIARLRRELKEAEASALASTKGREAVSPVEIPTGALVVVSSEQSEGSGFIGEMRGRTFFITNIHVLGAARGARVVTIDGAAVSLGSVAFLSRERDVAIVPIDWTGPVLPISSSLKFDKVKIGDGVTVMGNSSGAQVATRLTGEVRGLGPKEIEVSAKFVPGNSGSPIVLDALGKVVGVASHMRDFSAQNKWTADSELADIRRFGYRLDGEIKWERVALRELYRQSEIYNRFEDRTLVLGRIGYMLEHESKLMTNYRTHESLGYLFEAINTDFSWNRGTNSAHNQLLLKRFINAMIMELQNDRAETGKALRIEFYKERFREIETARDTVRLSLQRFASARL